MTRNERIKFILERKGIGYEKVGERLNVTKQAVANRLNRDKEIDDFAFINAVSDLTGVSIPIIMNGEGFKEMFFAGSKENKDDINYRELYESLKLEFAAIKGEKERLEKENTWLRGMIEKHTGLK